ncbi:unnamed protein product [Paramecium sonneborni]|uniref:Uncharacterized protein n=1 Tax=Paramecium sonneborni TaxID=65129 RepID=A0A8S1PLY4_9CILI|nr:unnamed protein product [Paramecium sonneborni]
MQNYIIFKFTQFSVLVTWDINVYQPNHKLLYSQLFNQNSSSYFYNWISEISLIKYSSSYRQIKQRFWKQILYNGLNNKAKYVLVGLQVMVETFILIFVQDEEKLHFLNVKTEIVKYGFGKQ